MERKDRLYWRHPKTKSPDETNRPNIDWIIKAQYASQLTTYFIERKHIQRKGLSPRKHIQMKWLSQLRFLWHLELQVLSSFLHLQAFVLHLDLQVHLNTPCPLFMLWSLAASLTPTSSSGTSSMVSSFWSQKENQFLAKYPEILPFRERRKWQRWSWRLRWRWWRWWWWWRWRRWWWWWWWWRWWRWWRWKW